MEVTMDDGSKQGASIHGEIHGNVSGQVGIGQDIKQSQLVNSSPAPVTEDELIRLKEQLAQLQETVSRQAPPEIQGAAVERVEELSQAVTASEPDLATMEYIKNWFVKNLPSLAGAVTSVIVNPIVGKLVEAAGDAVAAEFRRRFGAIPQE